MKLTIRHTLTLSLGAPPRAVQHLLLTPPATPQQKVLNWSIEMPGFPGAASFRDGYGNRAHLVTQVKPEGEIAVVVSGAVETVDRAGVLGRLEYDPTPVLFRRATASTKADPALGEGLSEREGRIALLHELMDRVHEAHATASELSQTSDGQSGSQAQSQSSAAKAAADVASRVHAFIGTARSLPIPARYVTGYLFDDGVASVHAWAEAWDEGLGWIGFDPTLNLCPAEQHVRLASGLDAASTVPIRTVPVWADMPVETVEIAEG
jgi:transglutaminase-like putative cysteine protease